MKKFLFLGLMLFGLLAVLESCLPVRATNDAATKFNPVAYAPPSPFMVECFSTDEEDADGHCPDATLFQDYIDSIISKIDVKNVGTYVNNVDALNKIRLHFPEISPNLIKPHMFKKLITIIDLMPYFEGVKHYAGIPKYVSISHFVIETGWGTSSAWKNKLNPGGIGGDGSLWSFKNLNHSYKEWAQVLSLDRYLTHVSDMTDPKCWITAYKKGGYWGSARGLSDRLWVVGSLGLPAIENRILLPASLSALASN